MMGSTKRKVCFFTATRAEYGHLRPVMLATRADPNFELQLVVSGTHLSAAHGYTVDAILEDGFVPTARVPMDLSLDTPEHLARAAGQCLEGCGRAFSELAPHVVVLLGDRYELLAAAHAATLCRVPIAHIHGGETTAGAMDDAIRHAITKLAHLHFVAAEPFAERVRQMGEAPERVFRVGAPGLDNLRDMPWLERSQLEKRVGIALEPPFILVTLHPETLHPGSAADLAQQTCAALGQIEGAAIVITQANADPEGQAINQVMAEFARSKPARVTCVPSLGQQGYLSALKLAQAVVGNSSSGIAEAPAVGTPTVDIGTRQAGRPRGPQVFHAEGSADAIERTVRLALAPHTQAARAPADIYGDGNSAARIVAVLKQFDLRGILFKQPVDRA